MMDTWATTTKYMFWLLVSWFKTPFPTTSIIWQLLNIIGEELDMSKQAILDMRRESLIATASGDNLDVFGGERDLPRIFGEDDDSYRTRLLTAYIVKKKGGTIPGMIEGLALVGVTATINELFKTDTSRWAEFEIIITAGDLELFNQSLFYQLVNDLKPAHTREIFVFELPLNEFDDGEDFDDDNFFDEFVEP